MHLQVMKVNHYCFTLAEKQDTAIESTVSCSDEVEEAITTAEAENGSTAAPVSLAEVVASDDASEQVVEGTC